MALPPRKLYWTNIIFFTVTPLAAVGALIWLYTHGGPHWGTWILTVAWLYAVGLGITAGYHRLFSHRSYDAVGPVKFILMLLGGASFEGSAIDWSSDHRTHHRYVDTPLDPYNIKEGFWHAHFGWLIKELVPARNHSNVKDLLSDPMLKFQDRHYVWMAALVCFGVPTVIASLWGDPWGGLILTGLSGMVFNHHATFSINSFCHWLGNQPYSIRHTGRDSWLTALFTYGEGYHNYHHEFPADYRNGIKVHHFDPGKWLIGFLSRFGWAYNLKRAQSEAILKTIWKTDEEKMVFKLAQKSGGVETRLQHILRTNRLRLEEAHHHFVKLREEYYRLKKSRLQTFHNQVEGLKTELKMARENFEKVLTEWQNLISHPSLSLQF